MMQPSEIRKNTTDTADKLSETDLNTVLVATDKFNKVTF